VVRCCESSGTSWGRAARQISGSHSVATFARIAGSNSSTRDPAGTRTYRGGTSAANAARTVLRANPNRRAMAFTAIPSDRCRHRISVHSSIMIIPSLWPRGSTFTECAFQRSSQHFDLRGVAMAKRGPKRDLDRELRYWELLSLGLGTVEACRRVGVARKTGYRWRVEMGGVIAVEPRSRIHRVGICRCSNVSGWRRCRHKASGSGPSLLGWVALPRRCRGS